jgi:hypothetical protein
VADRVLVERDDYFKASSATKLNYINSERFNRKHLLTRALYEQIRKEKQYIIPWERLFACCCRAICHRYKSWFLIASFALLIIYSLHQTTKLVRRRQAYKAKYDFRKIRDRN